MTLISECARAQTRTARDEAEKLIKLAVPEDGLCPIHRLFWML